MTRGDPAAAGTPKATVLAVPWRRVRPMPGQPRRRFDQEELERLAANIATVGQVTPAKVVAVRGDARHDYELIDGERRLRAVRIAGLETLDVEVVVEPDPVRRYELSVAANFGRSGHTPMEIAEACRRLRQPGVGRAGRTIDEIAAVIGMSTSAVSMYVKLLDLHPDLADRVDARKGSPERLNLTAAVKVANLPRDRQVDAYHKIVAEAKAHRLPQAIAAAVVVGEPPGVGRNGRARRSFDEVRNLTDRLTGYAAALNRPGVAAAGSLAARRPKDRDAVAALYRSLIAAATARLGELAP